MTSPRVWLLVENLAERRFLEAIFARRIEGGDVAVRDYLVRSAAIGMAKLSLLKQPERPLALVFNAATEAPTPVEEQRAMLGHLLADCGPPDRWHVTVVDPRINAWALADPRIKREFESRPDTDPRQNDPGVYYNQAVRIGELVKHTPFDVDALQKASPEFRDLEQFIDRHVEAARSRALAGASS
jgi:hypothetical protein